ncbi:hypothetical protein K439DRAFT_1632186 [Ramaria rubella]|nr:hypothetical protein K439DRAFT_1632186 [Ramaria rubella]
MSLFSKLRRSSTAGDRYATRTSSYASSNSTRRHERHERDRVGSGAFIPHVSYENIPYLPSESVTNRGASSEVSLRSEYTHLDNDTNRYPKMSASFSGPPSQTMTRKQRAEMYNEAELNTNGRIMESQMAPVLSIGSLSVMWDVRYSPSYMRQHQSDSPYDDMRAPALSTQSQFLCIISHDFPWTVAVSRNDGRPLTVIDVFEALHESLQKEVRRSEWALAADVQRYIMLKANKARRRSETAMRIRRVDWLGTRCMFRGLERDEDLARKRLMPGDNPGEMWAVRFSSLH